MLLYLIILNTLCGRRYFPYIEEQTGAHKEWLSQDEVIVFQKKNIQDFPGSLVVKTPCFHHRGTGSVPGGGSSPCHVIRPGKRQGCTFSLDFLKSRTSILPHSFYHSSTMLCFPKLLVYLL